MSNLSIVGIAGSLTTPSSSRRLVDLTLAQIGQRIAGNSHVIDIAALGSLAVHSREAADEELEAALRAVEEADLIVAATPVYKGSYSGLFKHFVDLLDYRSLVGTPVGLLATGGSERHALVVEHQLRPLFAVFQAQVLGTGLFVTAKDMADGRITDPTVLSRFERLIDEAVDALAARSTAKERTAA
ncbi:NAD(P)H-dependent oxidoreductase [Azospirillum picis]|uniref:FMN reductase n=1 Tax=Azospirillum picis TaxID=488438 RepID=A0ABU0MW28_9PROT|nr:NAD(P)H-dependent oxidoreductase [Azospirillum picis]MBP2303529.1 FMN reductase [Azospirillum picis]MDQ0537393.1 FMN reductase [Azospirillum picis]